MGPSTRSGCRARSPDEDELEGAGTQSPPRSARGQGSSKNSGPAATRPASTRPRAPSQKQAEMGTTTPPAIPSLY